MVLCHTGAFAIGFGDISLRSNLGDVLRVQLAMSGATEDILVPSCIKVKPWTAS